MTLGEIKTQFAAILNRRDITPTLTTTFITQSIQRIQRLLRTPGQEKVALYEWQEDSSGIPIPSDYLRMISLDTVDNPNSPIQLRKTDLNTIGSIIHNVGHPQLYVRRYNSFLIGPTPAVGTQFILTYYADYSALPTDASENSLTASAGDAVIYGALSYAADYYLDDRRGPFEERFLSILNELQLQADDDELINAAVTPSQSFDY